MKQEIKTLLKEVLIGAFVVGVALSMTLSMIIATTELVQYFIRKQLQ